MYSFTSAHGTTQPRSIQIVARRMDVPHRRAQAAIAGLPQGASRRWQLMTATTCALAALWSYVTFFGFS